MTATIINYVHIISAVLIIAFVLLQNRGTGLSEVFGGGSESYYTRRGFDKVLFVGTIVLAGIFVGSALAKSILVS